MTDPGCNRRLFELAAIGVPQVVEDRPDIHRHFREGSEILVARSAADLKGLLAEALQDRAWSEQVAAGARQRALTEHTYEAVGGTPPGARLLALLGCAVVVLLAVRGGQQRVGTDFYVFWQGGYDFARGLPLYQGEGPRTFLYPPFAAQLFQVLAVFPLKAAGALFYFASVALIAAAAWLTRDIVRRLGVEPSRHLPLVLAGVFSGQFILNNLNLLQVNLVTFVLCLLGVLGASPSDWDAGAVGWIVIATPLIKITPTLLRRMGRGSWTVARVRSRTRGRAGLPSSAHRAARTEPWIADLDCRPLN